MTNHSEPPHSLKEDAQEHLLKIQKSTALISSEDLTKICAFLEKNKPQLMIQSEVSEPYLLLKKSETKLNYLIRMRKGKKIEIFLDNFHPFFLDGNRFILRAVNYEKARLELIALSVVKNAEMKEFLLNERKYLRHFQNKVGIINTYDSFDYPFGNEERFENVQEWLNMGPLISSRSNIFSDKDKIKVGQNLLEGLSLLHDENLVHRNIRSGTVLVSKWNNIANGVLADFRVTSPVSKVTSFIGLPQYYSPEIISGLIKREKVPLDKYAKGCDVWQMGCMFCLLFLDLQVPWMSLLERYPHQAPYTKEVFEETVKLMKTFLPAQKSPIGKLIENMMNPDPEKRLTAKAALDLILKL